MGKGGRDEEGRPCVLTRRSVVGNRNRTAQNLHRPWSMCRDGSLNRRVLRNSRCWKKPSVFACLSTFARKINSASWWSSPRACPRKIRTKSTMVRKEKSTFLVRAANAPVRAANAPYGELHTSTNSHSLDHERGEHTTRRLCSGRGLGQSRTNLRRSKAWFTVYACVLQYTRRTTSHHAAPWRTVRIKSHQFAPIEQCSIFCARPRDFAAARLRL